MSIAALPTGAGRLIGRDVELTRLNTAWKSTEAGAPAEKKTNVVVLHAIGGAGKTALMRRFVDDLANEGFPGAHKVFGWSAYSQGSGEDRTSMPTSSSPTRCGTSATTSTPSRSGTRWRRAAPWRGWSRRGAAC